MADSPASRLGVLFRGLTRAYGVYNIPSGAQADAKGKIEGQRRTVRKPVTDQLWEAHLEGRQGLGIVPVNEDGISYFSAIDIDIYPLDIAKLELQCAQLALPLIPTRTKSGGVHLYLFTPEGSPASLVRAKLSQWAAVLGYPGSEVFPKQDKVASEDDTGNWINIPYFGGAATQRYGIVNGEPLNLEQYLERASRLASTTKQLDSFDVTKELTHTDDSNDFIQAPPCLQCLARNKGFVVGSRNNGLFAVGVYLRKRYPEEWVEKLYEYNKNYITDPLESSDVKVIAKSVARKNYNYNCKDQPIKAYCNRSVCVTREFGVSSGDDVNWGITIEPKATMVNTRPPYWLVVVNGIRVKFMSEDLQSQTRFQRVCMENIRYLPSLLPSAKWKSVVNEILTTATISEAPDDASLSGELAYHLQQFCTVFPQAETREELLVGKPFTEDGVTYFRAGDFKRYLESQRFHGLGNNGHGSVNLYAELRELGVTHKQLWIQTQNIWVWSIKQYTHTAVEVPPKRVHNGGDM